MGIIRNAANRKIRGRIGDTTYYVSLDRQIARQALNSSNYGESARRTEAQQSRRVKWSNLVNFYKLSKRWMPKAFESKKKGQSDYNRFMSINLPYTSVALTRDEALQGACVVEPFIVSQGSLASIEGAFQNNTYVTNLALGFDIDADVTTVSEFTRGLIANNIFVEEGMQLSFVSYQQFTNSAGVPQCTCAFYEVTLDLNNNEPVNKYLPYFCCNTEATDSVCAIDISTGCFAYILSDQRGGKIRVSSQTLINNNRSMISLYSSASQRQKSIDSYGVDTEVVLSPITIVSQQPLEQPVTIDSFTSASLSLPVAPWAYIGKAGDVLYNQVTKLRFSNMAGKSISTIKAITTNEDAVGTATPGTWVVSDNLVTLAAPAWPTGAYLNYVCKAIEVTFTTGEVARIDFRETEAEIHE